MDAKIEDRIEKAILFVPLFVGFIWMAYVVFDSQLPEPGMKLAPSKLEGLVTALFVFIIMYSIVLIVIFYTRGKKHMQMQQQAVLETPMQKETPSVAEKEVKTAVVKKKVAVKKAAAKPAKKVASKKRK